VDFHFGGERERFQRQRRHFPGGIARVGGYAAVVGGQMQDRRRSRTSGNRHHIIEFQRLVNGGQRVESIGARCSDGEAEVDLGVRTYGGRHTASL